MNGFDVIAQLQTDNMPLVIFVTAFDQYAVDAFKVHAVDYVLKPIDDDRLHEAIERAVSHREQEDSSRTKEKLVELVMGMTGASIKWVDAAGDYMCVHAEGKTHIMRITMKQLEQMLNPAIFLRIHRSTIVNADSITSAQTLNNGEYMLTLEGGSQLKVSRSYRDKVKHLLTA